MRIVNRNYNLDLNNDGTTDFVVTESNTTRKAACYGGVRHGPDNFGTLSLTSQGSNGFEVSSYAVAKLISGSPIGPSQSFATGSGVMESRALTWQYVQGQCLREYQADGNWPPPSDDYLGLAFWIDGKIHYGWAAINVSGLPQPYGAFLYATLKGYAYQTKAGKSIMAGQT